MPPPETSDMYKMAVEMADRVSARRGQANQFFLAIETLLLGVPASIALLLSEGAPTERHASVMSILGFCGLAVSAAWWLQLRSYRDLNAAKFKVINQIEADHFEVRPFTDEWKHLKADESIPRWRGRYAELGTVERVMPVVFAGLHLVLIVIGFA